jgi:DNA modification methylase
MNIETIRVGQSWAPLQPAYCRQLPPAGIGEATIPVPMPRNTILIGDARVQLATLPGASVDCIITSPPYFQLRDYGVTGQLGLEPTVEQWVDNLSEVFDEVARVLKPAGSLWLNLGDSFSRHSRAGAPPKGLLASPERLLIALMDRGWICRGKVIWSKPNPMPASVADRLSLTYEVVYFLVRSPRYFFDLDAIREPHRSRGSRTARPPIGRRPLWAGPLAGSQDGLRQARPDGVPGHALGKNPGDVWQVPTKGYRGAHFATFPEQLVVKPLLSTCPEAICTACGQAWRRQVTIERIPISAPTKRPRPTDPRVFRFKGYWQTVRHVGEPIPCGCNAPTVPGVVLDPFMGAGTVGVVAERFNRDWLGIEISPQFRDLALERIEQNRSARAGVEHAA